MKSILLFLLLASATAYGQAKLDTLTLTVFNGNNITGGSTGKLSVTTSSVWRVTYDTTKGWIKYIGIPRLYGFNLYPDRNTLEEATAPREYFTKATLILKKELMIGSSVFKIIVDGKEFDLTKRYEFIPDSEIVK